MTLILIIHIIITLTLIVSILLNRGTGSDAGAAFGSGSPKNLFSNHKVSDGNVRFNALLAIGFLTTSLLLASLSKDSQSELTQQLQEKNLPIVPDI